MARPWRITFSIVVDREAADGIEARAQAVEAVRQASRAVGGVVQAVDVVSIEPAERRSGRERRQPAGRQIRDSRTGELD